MWRDQGLINEAKLQTKGAQKPRLIRFAFKNVQTNNQTQKAN